MGELVPGPARVWWNDTEITQMLGTAQPDPEVTERIIPGMFHLAHPAPRRPFLYRGRRRRPSGGFGLFVAVFAALSAVPLIPVISAMAQIYG